MQNYTKHNKDQQQYFENTFKKTMQPVNTPYLNRHVDEMLIYAEITKNDRILDVGCGIGRYTLILAERGFKVEGLDLTPGLLEQLQEADGGKYNIPLYCSDIIDYPPELESKFDKVIGFFTLHHLHNIERCYHAMTELLKPGGKIVFLEPNAFNPLYYIQIAITPGMTWEGDGGITKMRKKVIFNAMKEAGLSNLDVGRFGFFPPFLANTSWGARLEGFLEKLPFLLPFLPFQLFTGTK
ncbi:class I SAM-dependent methyltransferase [candidate division KSB1 bacterium]|nr:class I SAM-dependent methyltransferase [candidate division KSB1 bacterium]